MAGGGSGNKRRRSSTKQPVEPPPDDEGSEYVPGEEGEESEADELDWEALTPEVLSKEKGKEPVASKGKDKGKGKAKEKGKEKEKVVYTRKKTGGVEIRDRHAQDVQLDPQRQSMYSSKQCIGERAVGVANLIERVPAFQALFENGNLHEICDFPEKDGYCLELIREFYMRAGHLSDSDGGPYLFTTSVRGVKLTITPDTVASVLGMAARTDGVDYLRSGFDASSDWRRIMNGVCMPGTVSNGILVMSKDLKIEYRFLNFVVCYNILPLANTKIVRWDRMLYMYLLGHPDLVQAGNININVPFLIWRRMAKDIKTSSQNERLPFPLIIMRILRLFDVDTRCSSYEHSLGEISESTFVKSSVMLRTPSRRSPSRRSSQRSSPPPAAPAAPGSSRPAEVSDDDISVSSVYREQQRLSGELERLNTEQARISQDQAKIVTDVARLNKKMSKIKRLLKALFDKMGCGSSDLPPSSGDSG